MAKNKTNRVRKIHLKKKAPPKAAYMKVFDMIAKGSAAGREGIKGIGKGRKIRRMLWTVSEAKKRKDQRFLAKSASATLFRDARKSRLAIRIRAVQKNLDIQSCVLGVEKDFGTTAKHITMATNKILTRFCSRTRNLRHQMKPKHIVDTFFSKRRNFMP